MGKQSLFAVRTVRNTQMHCRQSVLTGNMSRLHCRAQPVNAVWGNSCYLLWEPYRTHRYTVGSPYLTGNTSRLRYRAQPLILCGEVVAVSYENCMECTETLWAVHTSQETHRYTVWAEFTFLLLTAIVLEVATVVWKVTFLMPKQWEIWTAYLQRHWILMCV
jgi:hypothetical protein